jgi:undecaprenyl-diphosphatase
MDHSLLLQLNGLLVHHDIVEDPVSLFERAAEPLFALAVLALILFGGRRGERRRAAFAAGAGAAVAVLIAGIVAHLVGRPRPFVADQAVQLFTPHAADPGFPSDHATAAFAIATALFLRDRRLGIVALIAAAAVSVGRVAIGVHYPTDVLAGAVLGAACALALDRLGPARRSLARLADGFGALLAAATARLRPRGT